MFAPVGAKGLCALIDIKWCLQDFKISEGFHHEMFDEDGFPPEILRFVDFIDNINKPRFINMLYIQGGELELNYTDCPLELDNEELTCFVTMVNLYHIKSAIVKMENVTINNVTVTRVFQQFASSFNRSYPSPQVVSWSAGRVEDVRP